MRTGRWLVSPGFDLGLILGPPVVAVLLVLAIPGLHSSALPPWGWLVFVVFIDVAHVYASLYRTYFDPDEMARRQLHYLLTPLACLALGVFLHSVSSLLFWRVLAYVAVFHFVRQQYGFVMLYRYRGAETSLFDRRLDKATIYATMLYPLAFWHAAGDRAFEWFIAGDFVRLPAQVASLARWAYSLVLLVFVLRQIQLAVQGKALNWGKLGIVGATAAVWYVGIVLLNSDFAFTITNVVAHGVPYMALVWLYGRRKWSRERSWRHRVHQPLAFGAFVGLLLLLAYCEEGLWEVFVWQEHGALFAGFELPFTVPDSLLNLLVPLLTVPQATHYVLDAWIWKFDGSNPGLKQYILTETGA